MYYFGLIIQGQIQYLKKEVAWEFWAIIFGKIADNLGDFKKKWHKKGWGCVPCAPPMDSCLLLG